MDRSFDSIILNSLAEDAPGGDMTTLCTVSESAAAHGYFIAKEAGIIAGTDIAKRVFDLVGDGVETVFFVKEGDKAEKGQRIGEISGPARTVLTGERTALNLMQRASGIATATAEAVGRVSGTNAKICDTRKTMPGLRALDKYAVRIGGGTNHRFNLSDGILIKDNHIAAAGGITAAVSAARARAPHTLKIEVEVETFDQLREALDAKADIIMLDNMSVEDMRTAVGITAGRALLEASGNMGERDLRAVAETGVDLISVGALTHSVKALDISLKFTLS
ncbi:MAG: carboxylating nicotinate-nucleotide diphosphorylase [Clostridiales bacterium]|nr:carboxylating nicotinate-nucleotide diphosphorylase [Clostridiales bacterium]